MKLQNLLKRNIVNIVFCLGLIGKLAGTNWFIAKIHLSIEIKRRNQMPDNKCD